MRVRVREMETNSVQEIEALLAEYHIPHKNVTAEMVFKFIQQFNAGSSLSYVVGTTNNGQAVLRVVEKLMLSAHEGDDLDPDYASEAEEDEEEDEMDLVAEDSEEEEEANADDIAESESEEVDVEVVDVIEAITQEKDED